jgi:uncharacterized protein YkwD
MIRCVCAPSLLSLLTMAALLAGADDKKDNSDSKTAKKFEMTKQERELLDLLNKERVKEKLPPLKPHPTLFKVARAHSANMARQQKMEHVLDGKKPADRVEAAGYNWGKVTENLIVADQVDIPLEKIVKGWMDSETHRKNLLGKDVTETGLGIATNAKGEIYFTQVFARQRRVRQRR